jgi:hypothetical protein
MQFHPGRAIKILLHAADTRQKRTVSTHQRLTVKRIVEDKKNGFRVSD